MARQVGCDEESDWVDEEEGVAALSWGTVLTDTGEVWHEVGAVVAGLFGVGAGVVPCVGGAGVTGGVAVVGGCPAVPVPALCVAPALVVDGVVLGDRLSAAAAPAYVL